MLIDCKRLLEVDGETISFHHSLDLSDRTYGGNHPFREPVELNGTVQNRSGVSTISYEAVFVLHMECGRCLTAIDLPQTLRFEHVVVKQAYSEDRDDLVVAANGILSLDDLAADDILLQLPSKVVCKPDCKGLCEQCGKNLNLGPCGCSHHEVDPRLAVLKRLLDEQ